MATMSSTSSSVGSGSPCGACKFLRRKCATDCVFAPYFCSEQGPARFAAIHKVFGASNVSKLLLHVPVHDRCEAVVTIAYEAQARIRDPVYGCVSHIFALQQQVASLQAQLMQVKAQLMANNNIVDSRSLENNWMGFNIGGAGGGGGGFHQQHLSYQTNNYMNNNNNSSVSPQSSLDSSVDNNSSNDIGGGVQENRDEDDHHHQYYSPFQPCSKKRLVSNTDLSELQALAFRMMRN